MTVVDTVKSDPGAAHPAPRAVLVPVLGVLVALATVAALLFGVSWMLALGDESLELAQVRDTVLVDARQAAINLNTLDHRDVDAGLNLWEQSSTGPMLEEFRTNRAEYSALVVETLRVTEATVTDAAVAELDVRAGIARVIVGVDVRVTQDGQEPSLVRRSLQLEMTRTDQGWKASRADIVR